MSADSSRYVDASLNVDVELDAMPWIGAGLLAAGVVLALLATALVYGAVPKRGL